MKIRKKHSIFLGTAIVAFIASILLFIRLFNTQEPEKPVQDGFNEYKLRAAIKSRLIRIKDDTLYKHYFDTINNLYQQREYHPFWFEKIKDSAFASDFLKLIDSCVYHGLKPIHYGSDQLHYLLSRYKNIKGDSIYDYLAEIEIRVANGLTGLWHDKVIGRSNPYVVIGSKYTLPYPVNPGFKLFQPFVSKNPLVEIDTYKNRHPDYVRLQDMLRKAFSVTSGTETILDTTGITKIIKGDTTSLAPLIVRRLVELDYAPDSLLLEQQDSIYSTLLAGYMTKFQKSMKLTDDGIIGKTTLKALNASNNDRINEIRANMERLRWYDIEPEKPYIFVNLPEFVLYMIYEDSIKNMRACIGSGKEKNFEQKLLKYAISNRYADKPQNHETPQIYSNIDYVVLNPTWTVPSSIVGREMFSRIVRDPGYLVRNGYKVFRDGKEINPFHINWKRFSPGRIPYSIRQEPGDDNSLGKIKFTFKNAFSIYMHDTPLKSKFKLNNRAVSHGCVRVEDPVALAEFILQKNEIVTNDRLRMMMGMAPKDSMTFLKWDADTLLQQKKIVKSTKAIHVENGMTVYFDYKTIVFDAEGKPQFIFDCYDKNRAIIAAINKP